jgi:hypothetical protein
MSTLRRVGDREDRQDAVGVRLPIQLQIGARSSAVGGRSHHGRHLPVAYSCGRLTNRGVVQARSMGKSEPVTAAIKDVVR